MSCLRVEREAVDDGAHDRECCIVPALPTDCGRAGVEIFPNPIEEVGFGGHAAGVDWCG
jgi:hypothetical protein